MGSNLSRLMVYYWNSINYKTLIRKLGRVLYDLMELLILLYFIFQKYITIKKLYKIFIVNAHLFLNLKNICASKAFHRNC